MLIGSGTFCRDTANVWMILGYIVVVIKIVIPLALIILGMVDLGKAVVASKDDAVSKSVSSLIKRFIAAIVVFFIPTIVSALFNAIQLSGFGKETDASVCLQCITNVNSGDKIAVKDDEVQLVIQKTCKEWAESVDTSITK